MVFANLTGFILSLLPFPSLPLPLPLSVIMPDIRNPRRILLLCYPNVSLELITSGEPFQSPPPPSQYIELTLSALSTSSEPVASEDIVHHISTPYYSASIPIWTDRIENPEVWAKEWKEMQGATDVVKAVGAWIVAFGKRTDVVSFPKVSLVLLARSLGFTRGRESSGS